MGCQCYQDCIQVNSLLTHPPPSYFCGHPWLQAVEYSEQRLSSDIKSRLYEESLASPVPRDNVTCLVFLARGLPEAAGKWSVACNR